MKYAVYEVFEDGKKFCLFEHKDKFECECWAANHAECTNALRTGRAYLVIESVD